MSMRILVVDDNSFMRITLRRIIENLGYEVVGEGSDGFEAIMLYKAYKPDLVTMDITMPRKDGIAATREITALD